MRYAKYGMGGMFGAAKKKSGLVYANNGTSVPGEGDPKKKKDSSTVRDNFERVPTAEVSYRNNEGMMEAQGEGKIDAYNFELPASGMLDDLDEATKERVVSSPFGKEYLQGKGGGSLDAAYNEYAAKVNTFMESDPQGALAVVNQMIESGNPNFQVLQGKSDAEKLDMAKRYMTDKKIGDFHGALTFGEKIMPKASFYNPNTNTSSVSNVRTGEIPEILRSVGDDKLEEGQVMAFKRFSDEMGIDVSKDTPDARRAFNLFIQDNPPGDFSKGQNDGKDNYMFIKEGEKAAQQKLMTAKEKQEARIRERQRIINQQIENQGKRSGGMGMRISKYADKGTRVPTEEQRERGVTSTSKGIFNDVEIFRDNKGERLLTVKDRTKLGKFFLKGDQKVRFH